MSQSACPDQLHLTVSPDLAGHRLDKILAQSFELSRARFQALIHDGQVRINAATISEPKYPVKLGDEITITLPAPKPAAPFPQKIALDVVFEDAHLIVINKPAGMVVHPAPGAPDGTLVNALLAHCGDDLSGIGGIKRPGIVHRLDKDTSGLLVVAKSDRAHHHLSEQFKVHGRDGRLQRNYLAVVWGHPEPVTGTVQTFIARSSANRQKMAVSRRDGREAITHYQRSETYADAQGKPLASLVDCRLETGRTHQIRVHLAHINHPLLGDDLYGSGFKASQSRLSSAQLAALEAMRGQALHAYKLGFEHPATQAAMSFETQPPILIDQLIQSLRGVSSS